MMRLRCLFSSFDPATSAGLDYGLVVTVEVLLMMEPFACRASSTPPPADAASVSVTGVVGAPAANGVFTNWMTVLPAGCSAMRSATAIAGEARLPLVGTIEMANALSARKAGVSTDCTLI